jgi:hypothetical protein
MAQEIEVKIRVDANQAESSVNKFGDAIENTEKSVTSLKGQLRQAQAEVAALSDKFGATSREAVNAAKKAAELVDKIGDAKALTDAFNPDAKFRALSGSLGGVAGGFSVVTGAMGALGGESKDVENAILKVQSAMAISSGLQAVGESVDQFKILGTVIKNTTIAQKALTVYQTAYNFVNAATTTGLKLLRGALIATGIGALIVGMGLLISNFDKVKAAVMNLIPGLAKVGDFVGGIVESITDFVGATSDASRAVNKLKKDADDTLSVNKKFMQEHGSQVDEYTKKKIDAKNKYAEAVKEDGANQVALSKELNRELAQIEFSRGDEKRKIQKEQIEKSEKDKEALEEKASAKTLQKAEEEKNRLAEIEKERQALIGRQGEKARDEYEAAEKLIADAKKANSDALLTEKELAIQNENDAFELKKQDLLSKGLSIEEIEIQHLNNLNNISLIAQQKQYNDDKEFSEARLQIENAYQDSKRNALDAGMNILQQFAGKNKTVALSILAIQKGLAIADVVVGASKAISLATSALAAVPAVIGVVPNPMYAVQAAATLKGIATTKIGAATSIASILASGIGSAMSITGGGSNPASSTTSSGGIATPNMIQASPSVVAPSGVNQLASTLGQNVPIKAYVVSKDMTSQQSLDRNITDTASIG